jgi:glycerophosphoryl diester phosphodiesterase
MRYWHGTVVRRVVAFGLIASAAVFTAAHAASMLPIIIGHRGASGHRPEHTLESYRLAVEMGADFIEPDLVSTKDGVLIVRHENEIGGTTDVASKFPARKRTARIDGQDLTGWFTEDFTLAEIKTLRARERLEFRSHAYDGQFEIPTFDDVIELAQRLGREAGRTIGIYPETKHPTFHRQTLHLPLEGRLVKVLKRNDLNKRSSPVIIQSFEQGSLKLLNTKTPVRLVQLVDANDTDANGDPTYVAPFDRPYDWTVSGNPTLMSRTFGFFATDAGLTEIKTYADGIGPWKVYIVGTDPDGNIKKTTDLIARAHAHGLKIHTWTFRDDSYPAGFTGGPIDEYLTFFEMGIDGVFSDFAASAFAAREIFRGP